MDEYEEWLEDKIDICREHAKLQMELWAFCQALKKYRELKPKQTPEEPEEIQQSQF